MNNDKLASRMSLSDDYFLPWLSLLPFISFVVLGVLKEHVEKGHADGHSTDPK
jgi:hypothetical protein